jgi:hypothetical protein
MINLLKEYDDKAQKTNTPNEKIELKISSIILRLYLYLLVKFKPVSSIPINKISYIIKIVIKVPKIISKARKLLIIFLNIKSSKLTLFSIIFFERFTLK